MVPAPGSPERPVCCAISALRGLSADHLRELHALGVDFFQLRDREVSDGEFDRFLDGLAAGAPEVLSRVIVNDRLALAATFPVAGVHLPEAGFPVAAVRARFPRGRLLLGRSVHRLEAAVAAERDGADYVILGPVAPTGGKRPLRPEVFRETCQALRIPVWVVGGLTPENLDRLRGAGVSGFAAIRAFRDPGRARAFVARAAAVSRGSKLTGVLRAACGKSHAAFERRCITAEPAPHREKRPRAGPPAHPAGHENA